VSRGYNCYRSGRIARPPVVDRDQTALIKLLETHGLDVIPIKLRHSKLMGGGFHCITLDTRRKGALERYFD
jgi:N-dimethylarginine dimethylaminohydrolase